MQVEPVEPGSDDSKLPSALLQPVVTTGPSLTYRDSVVVNGRILRIKHPNGKILTHMTLIVVNLNFVRRHGDGAASFGRDAISLA